MREDGDTRHWANANVTREAQAEVRRATGIPNRRSWEDLPPTLTSGCAVRLKGKEPSFCTCEGKIQFGSLPPLPCCWLDIISKNGIQDSQSQIQCTDLLQSYWTFREEGFVQEGTPSCVKIHACVLPADMYGTVKWYIHDPNERWQEATLNLFTVTTIQQQMVAVNPIYKGIILTWSTPAAPFNGERSPEVDCGRDLYIDVALSQHQQICVDVGISWWTQRKQIDVPAVGSRWIEQWVW